MVEDFFDHLMSVIQLKIATTRNLGQHKNKYKVEIFHWCHWELEACLPSAKMIGVRVPT